MIINIHRCVNINTIVNVWNINFMINCWFKNKKLYILWCLIDPYIIFLINKLVLINILSFRWSLCTVIINTHEFIKNQIFIILYTICCMYHSNSSMYSTCMLCMYVCMYVCKIYVWCMLKYCTVRKEGTVTCCFTYYF